MSRSVGPILITGCSSGIGRAVATRLLESGHVVYATARDPGRLSELAAAGARTLELDVCDDESARAAVAYVEDRHGAVGVLVNNAGFGEYGPVETVPLDAARRQFETNFFGTARMCQLVLPAMRRVRGGRIVTMSSVGGRLTFPGGGFYNASKFAVESLSDALRFEAAPFGVSVSVVEPNLVRGTHFEDGVVESLRRNGAGDGCYDELRRAIVDQAQRCFTSPGMSATPDDVARVVDTAVVARRPRTRYAVSANGRFLMGLRKLMSDRAFDSMMRSQFGLTAGGHYTGKHSDRASGAATDRAGGDGATGPARGDGGPVRAERAPAR